MPAAAVHPSREVLAAFGSGQLADQAASTVSQHLEQCATCTALVADLEPDSFAAKLEHAKPSGSSIPPGRGSTRVSGLSGMGKNSSPAGAPVPELPIELAEHAKFRIIRELGRGGMGVVYLAEHKFMGKQVALKVLNPAVLDSPDALPRFLKEVRAAAQLDHPNIVHAHDAEQAGNLHFLMMEFVEGTDLAKLVKQKGPRSVSFGCYFARQAALGLQHAHEKGMTHRDIKPHNLMVTPKGQVKVLDFGLARVRSEGRNGGGLTAADSFMGTPEYVAPEQATDARQADIRSDIYSLGCTLYYLLTGRPPFREDTVVKTVLAQISKVPQPLHEIRPEIPAELSALVDKMLAKDPANRFQTPGEVAKLLLPFIKREAKGEAAAAFPEGVVSPVKRAALEGEKPEAAPAWKRPSLLAGAAVAVLVLILGGLWASGVFKVKTKDGIIVLENLPPDVEVTVDGGMVTLQTINGEPFAISIAAGKKTRLQVKKDGFTTFGEEVEIDAGGRRFIAVRLEPLPIAAPIPIVKNVKKTDYDAIATGKWIAVLEGEMDLENKSVFIPDQKAGDVILRARVKKVSGQNLSLSLRRDEERPPKQGYSAWFNGGDWFGIGKSSDGWKDLVDWHAPTDFEDFFEFAFSAIGDTLTIYADGKLIGEVRDSDYRGGSLLIAAVRGRSLFQNVEIMILDKPAPPTLAGQDLVLDLGAGVKMPLVRIKAGTFLMGSPGSDKDAPANEKPQHEVKITRDFFLGKFDVTRQDFARFVEEENYKTDAEQNGQGGWGYNAANNPLEQRAQFTWRDPGFEQTGRHPVVNVSWNDANAFCRWLSKRTGRRCELPTEAQWEYACRAGTTTRYFTGDDSGRLKGYANIADETLKSMAINWTSARYYISFADGFPFTSPVEAMKPNPWGLHDMTGNVWQWCSDWYVEKYYEYSPSADPPGPEVPDKGDVRVRRGGSWYCGPRFWRSAARLNLFGQPGTCFYDCGFRISIRID